MNAKILIGEGDTATRLGLVSFLEGEGYSVAAAGDCAQTIRLFNQQKFDLLMLCLTMSKGYNGDLCREVRARHAHLPVLFLTVQGDEDAGRGAELKLGADDDYVTKPFVISELSARVEALLRRSRPWQ